MDTKTDKALRAETTSFDEGRELDALIAERVMGWKRHPTKPHPTDNRSIGGVLYCPPNAPYLSSLNVVPPYSTDIAAAWEVAEKMVGDGHVFIVKGDGLRTGDFSPRWTVLCDNLPRTDDDSAPLAICRAALKAVADKEVGTARSAL
jgi:hypothetical protein